jgi:hypothetical protein
VADPRGGGGGGGSRPPPQRRKFFFFIALQQAKPAVRRNFMATLNKTVIIHASLRPECKKTHLHSVIRNIFPICTPREAYLGPFWLSGYFFNVLALGSEALASTVYLYHLGLASRRRRLELIFQILNTTKIFKNTA